jgi:cysteine-rich repeat protein
VQVCGDGVVAEGRGEDCDDRNLRDGVICHRVLAHARSQPRVCAQAAARTDALRIYDKDHNVWIAHVCT